jgi:hypothetical protein
MQYLTKEVLNKFPESILINTLEDGKEKLDFVNHIFKQKIAKVDDLESKIDLKDIMVRLQKDHDMFEGPQQETKITMHELIEKNRLDENLIFTLVQNEESKNQDGNEEINEIFQVKTVKIKWKMNKDAFLYTFIDSSNLIKLEEAK